MGSEISQVSRKRKIAMANMVCAGCVLLSLAGCASSPIEMKDRKAGTPSLRLAVSLDDDKTAPSTYRSGSAIEIGFAKVHANGDQTLAAGQEPVLINGVTFAAPTTIHNNLNFNYTSMAYRWRKFPDDSKLGFEFFGGIGRASLDMDLTSGAQSASGKYLNAGLHYGAAAIWRARPTTTLQLRWSGFDSPSNFLALDEGVSGLGRYELLLTQALGEHAELRAGFSKWQVNGAAGPVDSQFDVTFSGPEVELGFNF